MVSAGAEEATPAAAAMVPAVVQDRSGRGQLGSNLIASSVLQLAMQKRLPLAIMRSINT